MRDRSQASSKPDAASSGLLPHPVLEAMRPVVHSIARAFGRHCEVILHDFRTPQASVIEIAGNLTGRSVGDPVNDINSWLLARGREVRSKEVEIVRTARGRTLKSTRTLFREADGTIFGCLCINLNVTDLLAVSHAVTDMLGVGDLLGGSVKRVDDIGDLVQTVLMSEESRSGRRLDAAVPADRPDIVRILSEQGIFTLKRAVPRVAAHLGLSRATIYSYLSRLDPVTKSKRVEQPAPHASRHVPPE